MSFAMELHPAARWRASAESDSAQGADGVEALAQSAWAALLSSPWERDPDPASMPVHEYDRDRPSGQAYKAVWGYDRAARTQRSCCGMACYTFRIPDDALDAGNADGAAAVGVVAARIAVDRYCDQGAVLYAELSDSPSPPPPSAVASLAQALGTAWFPTSAQAGPDGSSAPAPNRRSGDGGEASFDLGGAAPRRWLHVYLLLADYLGVRDAWIEGGAMFDGESATVLFSREVAAGGGAAPAASTRLVVGRLDYSAQGAPAPASAVAKLPRASLWANWRVQPDPDAFGALADGDFDSRAENLLSLLFNSTSLCDGRAAPLASTSSELSGTGRCEVSVGSAPSVRFAAHVAHGLTRRRTFRGLRLSSPLNPAGAPQIPYRVCVYGIRDLPFFAATPSSATPVPWWGDVIREDARRGRLRSMRFLSSPAAAGASGAEITSEALSSSATSALPVEPLACLDADGEVSDIPFGSPWESGELSTVVLALVPNGAPADPESSSEALDASVSRQVAVSLPNAGGSAVTATRRSAAVALTFTSTPAWFLAPGGSTNNADQVAFLLEKGIVPKATSTTSGGATLYRWKTHPSSISKTVSTRLRIGYLFTASFGGKTYAFDGAARPAYATASVDWVSMSFETASDASVADERGDAFGSVPPTTVSLTGTAGDGSSLTIKLSMPGVTLKTHAETGYISVVTAGQVCDPPSGSGMFMGAPSSTSWVSATTDTGYDYAFADAAAGAVSAAVSETGEVSFQRGGETFTAALPARTSQISVNVADKGGDPVAAGPGSTSTRCTVSATLPARTHILRFSGSGGTVLSATVSLPAQWFTSGTAGSYGGVLYVKASDVYNGAASRVADWTAQAAGAVAVSETSADQDIDLGVLSLYE